MKVIAAIALVASVATVVIGVRHDEPDDRTRRWTFAGRAERAATYGFETPVPSAGSWIVESDPGATGRRALVNHPGTADQPAALAIVGGLSTADATLATRCRGECGLVFRVLDARTHYVARLETAPAQLVLGVVEGGAERELARREVEPSQGWRDLAVIVAGDRIRVDVDGEGVVDVRDETLRTPGGKGLWAEAAGSAAFDVFTLTPAPRDEI